MSYSILGISAYYHDSAASLLINGKLISAAQEERFTRKKHDSSFPINAVRYVLEEGGIELSSLDAISFYDKPFIKFERLLETYHSFAPKGLHSFLSAIPVWIKERLFIRKIIRDELAIFGKYVPKLFFPEHHLSHAASAFYPSPFDNAAILTIDGVGEWATTTIGYGEKNAITILRELDFPHSVGLLYSAFTYYCGFKVNSGEYKLMGLAPYGISDSMQTVEYINIIKEELVDIRNDGSILLNMDYFDFAAGLRMCNDKKWEKLFSLKKREPETYIAEPYMNLALAAQNVTEEIILKLARTSKKLTENNNFVMAGGVALNCVANGKLLKTGIFDNIWIQPAAGDAGGAVGAAYAVWHIWKNEKRTISNESDSMNGAFLGPEYTQKDIKKVANRFDAPYKCYIDIDELVFEVAGLLANENVIGWFQGRMEFGPRALGNRSIIADARNPEMQKKLNLKIKHREGFRPFAPSVLEEDIQEYFDLKQHSPYMLFVAPVKVCRRNSLPENYRSMDMVEKLYHQRSDIPAITHIDFSARIQSVNRDTNEIFWKLLKAFKSLTGYGILVNTSFNVRGEPLVCTPEDAYRCFMKTEMDYLVMGNRLFTKKEQRALDKDISWLKEFDFD